MCLILRIIRDATHHYQVFFSCAILFDETVPDRVAEFSNRYTIPLNFIFSDANIDKAISLINILYEEQVNDL